MVELFPYSYKKGPWGVSRPTPQTPITSVPALETYISTGSPSSLLSLQKRVTRDPLITKNKENRCLITILIFNHLNLTLLC